MAIKLNCCVVTLHAPHKSHHLLLAVLVELLSRVRARRSFLIEVSFHQLIRVSKIMCNFLSTDNAKPIRTATCTVKKGFRLALKSHRGRPALPKVENPVLFHILLSTFDLLLL